MRFFSLFVLSLALILSSGCGYTTASLLPPGLESIHVDNFINKIDPAREVSNRRAAYFYQPGLETSITMAVIDGFIFDRHLDIESEKKADLLLEGELTDLRQYPLSYSRGGDIEEYRVEVVVDIKLYNNHTEKLMWSENSFMGESSYDISGPNAKSESEAIKDAVKDLAERIVERIVEAW